MRELFYRLKEKGIDCRENECVAQRSTFRIGGTAALSVYPKSAEELIYAVSAADSAGVRSEVLGNCSNILFDFERFNGALIFTSGLSGVSRDGDGLYAEAGASLAALSRRAEAEGLSGLEFACGIPGLVGGSVYMNAGAYGSDIASVLEYSDAFDRSTGELIRLRAHGFGYRHSVYMERPELVCLGARLALSRGDGAAIRERMAANMASRREKQPSLASAGSYFKRPEGSFAGKLIEDAGLKGTRIGGAEVSVKHAGFIINVGGATAADVLALEKKIKETVMSRFGVELEREVRLIRE